MTHKILTLATQDNATETSLFSGIAPNANGVITIDLVSDNTTDLTGRGFAVLNALVVTTTPIDPQPALLGDFDLDGDVDLTDLDQYNGNIGSAAIGALELLDLNDDGTVGADDFAQHYTTLVETSNGEKGTFAGDLNLDGTVDVLGDAFALIGNLNSSVWQLGTRRH